MWRRKDSRLEEIELLYRERRQDFVRVAQAIGGDRDGALDIVHEAFASVIKNRAAFRGDGPLEAWVYRVVVNAARKSLRPDVAELAELDGEIGTGSPALPELAPLIASLPERQRLALFLRHYADLDYRTIATVLGIEVGTVSATLASAHRNLRRTLQEVRSDA